MGGGECFLPPSPPLYTPATQAKRFRKAPFSCLTAEIKFPFHIFSRSVDGGLKEQQKESLQSSSISLVI